MSIRTDLVLDLRRQLLGPRAGRDEILLDPHKEYVTGVLSPQTDGPPAPDVDDEADLPEGDAEETEDSEDEAGVALPSGLAPALDPKSQPRSLGLTFMVRSAMAPVLNICVTYARYERPTGSNDPCRRRPIGHVFHNITAQDNWRDHAPSDVLVQMRHVPLADDLHRISVFLCNIRQVTDTHPVAEDFIFQSQIRVILGDGCSLDSVNQSFKARKDLENNLDEAALELLYRNRTAKARGHLCAAVWHGIDPESPLPDGSESPFAWEDRTSVDAADGDFFSTPDVRTDFLPVYPVIAPSPVWRSQYGQNPEFRAAHIAAAYDPEILQNLLRPLPEAYQRWIASLDVNGLPVTLQPAGQFHVDQCLTASGRIESAIRLLVADDDVRLAFCFANRAIYEQNQWRQDREVSAGRAAREFTWYPFQLAFILLALEGIADRNSPDRVLCDLLWFPTGGGKTEAYLGLVAFTLALRRLRAPADEDGHALETGLGVLSRYTLRLLTIQQFRRALGIITACEVLRVFRNADGTAGWRPNGCEHDHDHLWGVTRFSAGLWAGQGVTPNYLHARGFPVVIPGAIEILKGDRGEGEPAQVLNCPCCDAHLALAQPRHAGQESQAFPPGTSLTLHLVFFSDQLPPVLNPALLSGPDIRVQASTIHTHETPEYYTITLTLEAIGNGFSAQEIKRWWDSTLHTALGGSVHVSLACTSPSRPGYFFRHFVARQAKREEVYDFEIYCPNPECKLSAVTWQEKSPIPVHVTALPRGHQGWQQAIPPFQSARDPTIGTRIPIPARTVDEQIYRHPPSLLVATVDKFARLAYTPDAGCLFGNVTHFEKQLTVGDRRYGFCREERRPGLVRSVDWHIRPPDLILQDELHLIDGALGSMVGLYESAIDALCEERDSNITRPKYIASTATVRQAAQQVQALFARSLFQFPPSGLAADDSFFALTHEVHPAAELDRPGRLYLGIASPGKGAQTPIVRIWSVLLQAVEKARLAGATPEELDPFWTLVGYFNAIRELAGGAGLYRQDIPQRVGYMALTDGDPARDAGREAVELSSRADSLLLPTLLDRLAKNYQTGDAETVALATSMFGTGVDIARLGLMVVHGQPKSTSSYIQASGRVGRQSGGLVVTFLRASRPRDLDHYEFFTGYHRQLYRSVEPVTVAPFSPRARDRGLGPLCTILLRQAAQILGQPVPAFWSGDTGAPAMENQRGAPEVRALCELLEQRARQQPDGRRPEDDLTSAEVESELDRWRSLAGRHRTDLRYYEYAMQEVPRHPVVLGDPQHQLNNIEVAFENAPQSLREVEATTGFKV